VRSTTECSAAKELRRREPERSDRRASRKKFKTNFPVVLCVLSGDWFFTTGSTEDHRENL